MLLRILIGLIIAYTVLVILAWLFQDRMAFPAPSGALPADIELQRLGAPNREVHGEDVEPMLAEPRNEPFDDPAWVFEVRFFSVRL